MPKFILADEPTSDLDSMNADKILDLLVELKEKQNIGILFITHDLDLAVKIADFISIINNGKIIKNIIFNKNNTINHNNIKKEIIDLLREN